MPNASAAATSPEPLTLPPPSSGTNAPPPEAGTLAPAGPGAGAAAPSPGATATQPDVGTAAVQAGPEAGERFALPGYEILSELGRGGMGVVYKARQLGLNRVVAVKVLPHARHAGEAERTRFLREAEAIAGLQHPNVVQLFEAGQHDDLPYFTLELVPGGSLENRLRERPLGPEEAARVAREVARGVQHAHERGVIHRDLKPANILLAADGTAKAADFGLARRVEAGDGLTATGAVMGTPSYMAPEQARGQVGGVGPPADVYSLGAVLYECLTGRPPFKGATVMDTLAQVTSHDPVPVRRLQPKVPRDLETVCHRCLRKEPERRYGTAQALADDLGRFLAGEPVHARPVGLLERVARWVQRRPAAAGLLAVSVTAALALAGGGLWYNARLQDERDAARRAAEEAEQERRKAEAALAEGRRRLTLNYPAYGRACALAGRITSAPTPAAARDARREYRNLAAWLSLAAEPPVREALDRFGERVDGWAEGSPPRALQEAALQLGKACRASWLETVCAESPDVERRVRRLIYGRACDAVGRLAGAGDRVVAEADLGEFWELYWGEMVIVESEEVAGVMIALGQTLRGWQGGPPPAALRGQAEALHQECGTAPVRR